MRRRDEVETGEELSPRRRREGLDVVGKNLAVNTSRLDFRRYAYRFINDAPERMFRLTNQDDWDIVKADGSTIKPDRTDLGDAVSVVVGRNPDGSALRAYLCRKPLRYYEEDQTSKQNELDKQIAQLRKGNTRAGEPLGDYPISGGIRIA